MKTRVKPSQYPEIYLSFGMELIMNSKQNMSCAGDYLTPSQNLLATRIVGNNGNADPEGDRTVQISLGMMERLRTDDHY